MDAGLLIVRLVFGLLMAAHGAQKLFGWFGGYGLTAVSGYFETMGYRPGRLFAATAGASEVVGGLLIAGGFFGPVGPALVLAVMIVAIFAVHIQHGRGVDVDLIGPHRVEKHMADSRRCPNRRSRRTYFNLTTTSHSHPHPFKGIRSARKQIEMCYGGNTG